MAESRSLLEAEKVIDKVLDKGAWVFYERYLQTKIKAFNAKSTIRMFELFASVSQDPLLTPCYNRETNFTFFVSQLKMRHDKEPESREYWQETWAEDDEPVSFPPTYLFLY